MTVAKAKIMGYKIRPLGNPPKGLKTAFRVHVSVKVLLSLGLGSGARVRLTRTNDNRVCFALLYPVNNLDERIIQASDVLRETFDLLLGDEMSIEIDESNVKKINTVICEEVVHDGLLCMTRDDAGQRARWEEAVLDSLSSADRLTTSLQIQAKVGTEIRSFRIQKVNGSSAEGLHLVDSGMKVRLRLDGDAEEVMKVPRAGIGGLTEELNQLDHVLRRCNKEVQFVILHGPSGTGKTLMMNAIRRLQWSESIHLDAAKQMSRNSQAAWADLLDSVFAKAGDGPGSLITIEDLHVMTPHSNETGQSILATILRTNFHSLVEQKDARVLILATTNDVRGIAAILTAHGDIQTIRIRLPQPKQRQEILDVLVQTTQKHTISKETLVEVARQTHAYSGANLKSLLTTVVSGMENASLDQRLQDTSIANSEQEPLSTEITFASFEPALRSRHPTAMAGVDVDVPNVRFTDIGGQDDVKAHLEHKLRLPMMHPELFAACGVKAHKGLLLYGPPGCSKTLIARAVATEFGLNYIGIKASELVSKYVGESEHKMRELFQQARDASPCVIFLDEVDVMAANRDRAQGGPNTVETLLTEMDGLQPLEGVFVLAATNRPDILDPAVIRPGRLFPHYFVGPPDAVARRAIINIQLRGQPIRPELDLEIYVHKTEGCSGAEVETFCQEVLATWALELLKARQTPPICERHFEAPLANGCLTKKITKELIDNYMVWGRPTAVGEISQTGPSLDLSELSGHGMALGSPDP